MAIHSGNRAGRSPTPDRQIDSSIDLYGLGETFVRRRWTIAACVLAFIVLAFLALSLISPRYSATARILVDPREKQIVQNEIVQQGLGGDMALVDSQVEVITSEAVLGRVIEQTELAADPEFVPEADGERDPSEVALETLARATEVTRRENTYVLEITVTSKEAAKSARLANAVAAAYVADQTSSAAAAARDISSAIRGSLTELQKQLHDAEQKVEAFKRQHNISRSEGQLLGDRKLTDLSARQSEALARVNETAARLQVMQDALRTRGFVGAAVAGSDSSIGPLRIRLADARQRLAELEQELGPRHPRIIAARQEVAQAENTIREEGERLVASAQDDHRAALDALEKVNADLSEATAASFSTNEDLIRLRELEREAQSIRVVYESFLVRARETAQQESITARTARVIAEAAVPASPSFPPRAPLLVAAGILGLFVGIVVAILRDLISGMFTRQPEPLPLAPAASADVVVTGLVMVATLDEPDVARRGAVELAQGAMSRDRSVIFVDLARDEPASAAGFAEMASGEVSALDAVHTSPETGLQVLGAGRPIAVANLSREVVRAVFEAISAEYDDVVVNLGELDVEHSLPARMVADMARQAVLVIKGSQVGPRERRVVDELSKGGAVTVSVASLRAGARLDHVA